MTAALLIPQLASTGKGGSPCNPGYRMHSGMVVQLGHPAAHTLRALLIRGGKANNKRYANSVPLLLARQSMPPPPTHHKDRGNALADATSLPVAPPCNSNARDHHHHKQTMRPRCGSTQNVTQNASLSKGAVALGSRSKIGPTAAKADGTRAGANMRASSAHKVCQAMPNHSQHRQPPSSPGGGIQKRLIGKRGWLRRGAMRSGAVCTAMHAVAQARHALPACVMHVHMHLPPAGDSGIGSTGTVYEMHVMQKDAHRRPSA